MREYCHVEGHFEKDDKKPKQTARDMMRMMFAIDKNAFDGNREVTCYSCHRGSTRNRRMIPAVGGEVQRTSQIARDMASETSDLPANLPTADQLIANYVRALGGAAAIEKTHQPSGKRHYVNRRRESRSSIEIFESRPRTSARWSDICQKGDGITVFNGVARRFWSTDAGSSIA